MTTEQMLAQLIEQVNDLRQEFKATRAAVLNREAAAEYLGLSTRTLHDLVRAGRIKRVALSEGRFVFRREELDRYLAEQETVYSDEVETAGKRLYTECRSRG